MTEVHITAHDIVTSLQVCVQLKQLKMSQVELQQQLSTLNKQCLLLQEDNEKLLSIVDEQAKYEPSDCVCVCVFWWFGLWASSLCSELGNVHVFVGSDLIETFIYLFTKKDGLNTNITNPRPYYAYKSYVYVLINCKHKFAYISHITGEVIYIWFSHISGW